MEDTDPSKKLEQYLNELRKKRNIVFEKAAEVEDSAYLEHSKTFEKKEEFEHIFKRCFVWFRKKEN